MPGATRLSTILCVGLIAAAQAQPPSEPLEEVVVTGEFPGPGMWKVTQPDAAPGHTLWIVAAHPPLPKRMKWKSRDVEAVALGSQEILLDAGVQMEPDEKIGVFRGLSLLPAVLRARKNPDEMTLRDQLPPELYQRWLVQKKRYLGSDSGIEKWRPIFAAGKLRHEAIDDLGLRENGMVWEIVGKLAKKNKIKVTTPSLRFTFPTDGLKAKIKEFSREQLADTDCFATTLDLIDALANTDIQDRRAHAWATADLETLEQLPPLPNAYLSCATAVMSSQAAKDIVPSDIREQLYALWIEAAEKSLASNETTLSIVPMGKLLRDDGYLARLRTKGYTIEAPK